MRGKQHPRFQSTVNQTVFGSVIDREKVKAVCGLGRPFDNGSVVVGTMKPSDYGKSAVAKEEVICGTRN